MIKKLLGIVVLGLLWCNVCFSVTTEPLKIKSGEENHIYNIWIIDYNDFKKDFNSEVIRFCANQTIAGGGIQQLMDQTKCKYRAAVDLATKYKMHVDPMRKILHRWHETVFPMAKTTAIAVLRCQTKRCQEKLVDDYIEKAWNLEVRLFENLDKAVQEHATKDNAKYYAEKKKKEEGKLKIDDDEIIAASSGTGFFVSKKGHIVTNFHVIENCDSVKVNFKGKEIDSQVFAIDKKNDLAIIQTTTNPLKVFPVSNKDVILLQDVIVAGYPLGKNLSTAIKMHKGSVTALAGYEDNYSNFQTDATINQGNSGGPIIDKNGNVVGIAVATWVEEGVQGIHFGIKSSVLKTFANSKDLNFLQPNRREISKEKLGELISEATTYLECWMTGAKIKKMIAAGNSNKAIYSKFK